MEEFGAGFASGNRRLFACDTCVTAWDTLCGEGVPCVCNLLNFESQLSTAAVKSFTTICKKFGNGACSRSGDSEACSEQCEEDGNQTETTPAPSIALETFSTRTGELIEGHPLFMEDHQVPPLLYLAYRGQLTVHVRPLMTYNNILGATATAVYLYRHPLHRCNDYITNL